MATQQSNATNVDREPWWLTLTGCPSSCDECGDVLLTGEEVVFRYEPQGALCLACADKGGVEYHPSKRWREAQQEPQQQSMASDGLRCPHCGHSIAVRLV